MMAQPSFDGGRAFSVVKYGATMGRSVDNDELNWSARFFVRAGELVRLVDGHLRILISMQEEQGRIMTVDVEDGTGESR